MTWPAALAGVWHPVAYTSELRHHPLPVTLMDRPLVLFRGDSGVAVLEDRCPHRNVPLSAGRVVEDTIECPYHGWRFDRSGRCRLVPGSADFPARGAVALPVREEGGLIWTSLAEAPGPLPVLWPEMFDTAFDSFWWRLPPSRAAIGDAIENLLDPIHAYFLHPGLVRRAGRPGEVTMDFAAGIESASARYTEPREGMTWLQKLTEGGRVASWGRYRAPAQVQIAFEDGDGVHAAISVVFSPASARETRPFARFSTRRGRAPAWLKRLGIVAFHRRVLDQDLAMLRLQAESCERFGGPDYHSGPLDLWGPVIWAGLSGRTLPATKHTLQLSGQP